MGTRMYSIRELRRVVKESAEEFKPVLGKNVERDNKTINDKAYKDMAKDVKDYDGGVKADNRKVEYQYDDNRGMSDLQYDNVNNKFQEDQESRLKGYVNKQAEDLHKNDDFGNANFNYHVKPLKDKFKDNKHGKDVAKEIGLTSREIDKKDFENLHKGMFKENKVNKLTFKNTTFVNENHMLTKVPDNYKVEGKQFIMRDKMNHEYLVEWHNDEDVKVLNKTRIAEEQDRIKALFNYTRGNSNTTCNSRLTEEKKINDMVNKARLLIK